MVSFCKGSLGLIIKIPHELVTKLIVFCNLIHKLLGSAVGSNYYNPCDSCPSGTVTASYRSQSLYARSG